MMTEDEFIDRDQLDKLKLSTLVANPLFHTYKAKATCTEDEFHSFLAQEEMLIHPTIYFDTKWAEDNHVVIDEIKEWCYKKIDTSARFETLDTGDRPYALAEGCDIKIFFRSSIKPKTFVSDVTKHLESVSSFYYWKAQSLMRLYKDESWLDFICDDANDLLGSAVTDEYYDLFRPLRALLDDAVENTSVDLCKAVLCMEDAETVGSDEPEELKYKTQSLVDELEAVHKQLKRDILMFSAINQCGN